MHDYSAVEMSSGDSLSAVNISPQITFYIMIAQSHYMYCFLESPFDMSDMIKLIPLIGKMRQDKGSWHLGRRRD